MGRLFGLVLLVVGIFTALFASGWFILIALNFNRGVLIPLLIFAFIEAMAILMIVIGVRLLRKNKPLGAEPSPQAAGGLGDVKRYPANVPTSHELDGTPYTVQYTPPVKGKNSRPSSLTISTPVDCGCEFLMSVESWFDKSCKRFGIATEIQTGDENFDDQCYIRSDTPEFTSAYLNDPVKRVAILDLRRFGFLDVKLADRQLSLNWTGFDPLQHDRPDLLDEVGARLVLLARNLPAHQPEFDHHTGTHRKQWQLTLWLFLVCFAATAFALIPYTPIEISELLWRAAAVALIWPLFAYISAYVLSGTSRSHNAWGGLMIGSIFLFPLGCVGSLALGNGIADDSPEVTRKAVIVDKYTTKSKNSTNYHVRVASWRDPGDTISFQISGGEYGNVVPKQSQLEVVTKSGALGVEWMKSKKVLANPGR